ncbi:MAG TPA: hypothetical protein VEV43_15120, partial [Actinomycetota bacterium]|nr:hypothetical protein [Actinomycetota bacterium]
MVQRPSELEDLGIALGLIEGSGSSATLNTEFFTDPRGVLGGTLADPDRRAALVDLFTDLLGTEGTPHGFDAGTSADETWLPLVEGGPGGLYVLLTPHPPQTTDGVRVSVAGRVQHVDNGVDASASIVLPLICFDNGGLVPLVGTADGPVSIQCRVGGEDGPLIDDDGLVLHAVSVRATIATQALATPPATLQVLVEGLRFGADATPLDVDLADLAGSVGGPAAHLVLAALRAQASTSPELAQLFDLLGLGGAAGIPSLDLGALASDPHGTLTAWLRSVVLGTASRAAWLSKLAGLLGGSVPSPDELCFVDTTATKVCVTVAVDGDPTTGAPRVRIGLLARHEVAGIATGHLRATVNAVDVVLTQPPGVVVFPSARAVLRLEGTAGPLVHGPAANNRRIEVGSLDAGIELRPDGSIVPVLTANDAIVDLVGFPTLDLTDADAVIGAAEDVAETALNDLVGDLAGLLNGSPRVRALASLLGLVAPPGPAWAPALVNPASLLADPLREICCYHSRVLAEDGGWGRLLQQLVVLVQPGDDPPPALTGAGTAAEPWRAPFAVDGTKRVDLFALGRPPDGDHPQLVLGVAVRGATDIGDGKELGLIVRSEVLAATLPRAADCVGEASVTMMPLHEVVLRLGDDLHLDAGAVEVLADRVEVGVRWRPGDDLEPIVRVSDPRVSTGGSFVELPDIDGDIDLDALGTAGWQLFGDLLGAWFSGGGRSWWRLSALVGLLPGVPDAPQMLPIGDLALPRAWDGLLHLGRGHVTGNGTYDDPWEISTGAAGLPNPVLWLDPDGPPDLRLPRELFPPALSDALDNATTPLDPERLATLLGRAVTLSPTLADVVDEDLAAALRFLRDQLAGTDGLVAAAAQEVTGWNRIDLASALHLGEPAVLDLDAQVPGLPGGSPRVFVSAPLPWAAAWRGQDPARVIDLREAGREPATFDLDHVTAGGSWFVLLPPRADAVTATIADGLEGLRARLHAAVAAVRDAAGAPVVLVAHATSGHPARLVAADAGLVSDIVTVGTPHSTSAIGWVAQDEGRRALRALHRLRARARGAGADLGPLADLLDGPLAALEGIVAEVDGTDVLRRHVPFPFADYVTPASWPALAAGVTGHAVVATIVPAEVDGALTTLVGRAIEGLATLPAGRTAPTHLGIGLRGLRRDGSSLAGEVRVDTRARVDVHLVEITPGDHRAVPRLGIHADISRNGGWLVRPADVSMGRRQDPRVGRAEIDLALDLGDPSPAVSDPAPRLSARIVLHDVTVLGRFHERWVVDDTLLAALADGTSGGTGTLPEVRIVLGMVATALGNVGGTGPVRDLAGLLVALQVGTIDGNAFDFTTEGLERLLREPDQVVADLLADADRADDFLSALAACTGGTATGDTTMLGTGGLPFGMVGPLGSPSLRLRTSGPVEVAKQVTIDADVTIDATRRAHGSVTVTSPVDVGGLGNPRFVVGIDTATADLVTVAFELDGDGGGADRVALFPDPDLVALARLAGQVIAAEVARQALTWAHAQQPALVGAVLGAVGLLNPPAAPEPVRSLLGLIRDPVAWLTSDVALGAGGTALTPASVVAAVDAVAALLGQVPAGGVLTLPGGITLTASPDGDRT